MNWEPIGTIITSLIGGSVLMYFFAPKKSKTETSKMIIETSVITDNQQLQKDKFCQEQLQILEKKYKELQADFDAVRETLKAASARVDETETKYREALNTITFLNIELSAYKM